MSLALLCMSHRPLMDFNDPGADVRAEIDGLLGRARAFVVDYRPR